MSIRTYHVEARQINGFRIDAFARNHHLILDQAAPLGTDEGPAPLEYLLTALSGCLIGTASILARQKKIVLRSVDVRLEASRDTDGILGKGVARPGFESIQAVFFIDCDLTQAEKEAFIEAVIQRCPVSDNLHHPTPLSFHIGELSHHEQIATYRAG